MSDENKQNETVDPNAPIVMKLKKKYLTKRAWMRKNGLPILG